MWQPPRNAILVGVDGSRAALGAVRWAARDATLRNAPLALVHVIDAPMPGWFQVTALAEFSEWQDRRAREFVELAIKAAEESAGEGGRAQIEGQVVYSATVPTLVDLSKTVELVVVGHRGHGGVPARGLLGSVSSALVYHAHCPVAVIRDGEEPARNAARRPYWWASTGHRLRSWRPPSHSTRRRGEASVWSPCTPGWICKWPT